MEDQSRRAPGPVMRKRGSAAVTIQKGMTWEANGTAIRLPDGHAHDHRVTAVVVCPACLYTFSDG